MMAVGGGLGQAYGDDEKADIGIERLTPKDGPNEMSCHIIL